MGILSSKASDATKSGRASLWQEVSPRASAAAKKGRAVAGQLSAAARNHILKPAVNHWVRQTALLEQMKLLRTRPFSDKSILAQTPYSTTDTFFLGEIIDHELQNNLLAKIGYATVTAAILGTAVTLITVSTLHFSEVHDWQSFGWGAIFTVLGICFIGVGISHCREIFNKSCLNFSQILLNLDNAQKSDPTPPGAEDFVLALPSKMAQTALDVLQGNGHTALAQALRTHREAAFRSITT